MRQRVNSGERFRRGNAITILIVAGHTSPRSSFQTRPAVMAPRPAHHPEIQDKPPGFVGTDARQTRGQEQNCEVKYRVSVLP